MPPRCWPTRPSPTSALRAGAGITTRQSANRLQKLADRIRGRDRGVQLPGLLRFGTGDGSRIRTIMERRARQAHAVAAHAAVRTHFLGELCSDLPLPPDTPIDEHCGTCTACRRLPDAGHHRRPLRGRCPALHLLPDHRARRPDPGRPAPADGQPHLRLRRLPAVLSVELVRHNGDPISPRNGLDDSMLAALFAWSEADFDQRLQARQPDPPHRARALAAQHCRAFGNAPATPWSRSPCRHAATTLSRGPGACRLGPAPATKTPCNQRTSRYKVKRVSRLFRGHEPRSAKRSARNGRPADPLKRGKTIERWRRKVTGLQEPQVATAAGPPDKEVVVDSPPSCIPFARDPWSRYAIVGRRRPPP